ncbi:hypothetical protein AB8880_02685 [Alphaproteobacteria bacterium LSUCC0684]
MKKETFFIYFLFIFASYLLQIYAIYPAELALRTDVYVSKVSYVFIPHGMKILYALILGPAAFIYIFLAQLLFGLLTAGLSLTIVKGSLIGTMAVIIPILMINASLKRPLWKAPIDDEVININVLWLYLSISLMSSFINALSHQLLYGFEEVYFLFMMIIGDMIGSVVIFVLFLFVFRPIMNFLLLRKKYEQS